MKQDAKLRSPNIVTSFSFQIYDDFLDDHLNADHAWIEAVCINFHTNDYTFSNTDALKVRTFE